MQRTGLAVVFYHSYPNVPYKVHDVKAFRIPVFTRALPKIAISLSRYEQAKRMGLIKVSLA